MKEDDSLGKKIHVYRRTADPPKKVDSLGILNNRLDFSSGQPQLNSKKKMQTELLEEIMKDSPDLNKIRVLSTFGVDYNVKDPHSGITILHHAAFQGETDLMQMCIDSGLSVDEATKLGRTPLHFACSGNQRSAVVFLLNMGANANAQTCAGLTPAHLAVREEALAALRALLFSKEAKGKYVDIDKEDLERKTPVTMTSNKLIKDMLNKYKRSLFNETC